MSRPVVVADAGPLIALAGCDSLGLLLQVFDVVHIPQTVLNETTSDTLRPGAGRIANFVHAHAKVHADRNDEIFLATASYLDDGEAQAISLAKSLRCGVLIDERRGRNAVLRHGLPLFGVLGVLLQSKRVGSLDAVAPLLQRMQSNGYRISQVLIDAALKMANEN
jgi:predicted nucleic acid-binding protein